MMFLCSRLVGMRPVFTFKAVTLSLDAKTDVHWCSWHFHSFPQSIGAYSGYRICFLIWKFVENSKLKKKWSLLFGFWCWDLVWIFWHIPIWKIKAQISTALCMLSHQLLPLRNFSVGNCVQFPGITWVSSSIYALIYCTYPACLILVYLFTRK